MLNLNESRFSLSLLNCSLVAMLMLIAQLLSAKTEIEPRMDKVQVTAELNSKLLLAGEKQTAYLKVSLTGFELKRRDRSGLRAKSIRPKPPQTVERVDVGDAMQGVALRDRKCRYLPCESVRWQRSAERDSRTHDPGAPDRG